jgi:asparagine synthase (glutamine-hydrolysing)
MSKILASPHGAKGGPHLRGGARPRSCLFCDDRTPRSTAVKLNPERQVDLEQMCGLAGILTSKALPVGELAGTAQRMSARLAHRGPDDSGVWTETEGHAAFGFRRLAIVDLSELGHQPMHSPSGRFTLVFNGEVFNHHQLRKELEGAGFAFRGRSDTEVILAAFERWGIADATRRFVGMFAMAVWDAKTRCLSLIRDRLGIKPLFIATQPGVVSFASELKAIVAEPSFDRSIDRDALAEYLRYLYVPAPRTIYRSATKLRPGHILTITDPSLPPPQSVAYWSVEDAARRGIETPLDASDDEAVSDLQERLLEAVKLRMEADVPLGALLSGGIDSSTVVGLMQSAATRPVKTYSVAFETSAYNEAPHAARVAAHLGTDHTELLVTGADALSVVPQLPDMFDEPHADVSQIPAYLVCALARKEVTVALSGDGGDEVFCGYNRYTYGARLLGRLQRLPRPARRVLAAGIGGVSQRSWGNVTRALAPVVPPLRQHALAADKAQKVGRLLSSDSVSHMYRSLVSAWHQPERVVIGGQASEGAFERVLGTRDLPRLLDRMMLADQLTYLPDDQLAKVDRVSMAVSLEVRVPLLDHRVVEFAWTLPPRMKVRDGHGKWLLRQLLYRLVPRELVDRPKQGLSVPLASWLRGPLRPWAEELLSRDELERDGILHAAPIRGAWDALLQGQNTMDQALWGLLLFQQWRQRWQYSTI